MELGPVSKVTNMEYIIAKINIFWGVDCIRHAVAVKWLILNGNKYIRESANGKVSVFGTFMLYCFEYQLYETGFE